MKTLFLTLMILSSFSSFAASECSIQVPKNSTEKLKKILKKRGYEVTYSADATYSIQLVEYDLIESFWVPQPNGHQRIEDLTVGVSTLIDFKKEGRFIFQAHGDVRPLSISKTYTPSERQKQRSYKKALRDLRSNLYNCD